MDLFIYMAGITVTVNRTGYVDMLLREGIVFITILVYDILGRRQVEEGYRCNTKQEIVQKFSQPFLDFKLDHRERQPNETQ